MYSKNRYFNSLINIMLYAIGIATFTQFPYINKNLFSNINYAVWGGLFIITILDLKNLYFTSTFLDLLLYCFGSYLLEFFLIQIGTINSFSNFVKLVRIPILIYYITFYLSIQVDSLMLWRKINKVYLFFSLVLSAILSYDFLSTVSSWFNSQVYLYDYGTNKNSTAQILGNALIILLFSFSNKSKKNILIKIIGSFFIVAALIYVQSRAVLFSLILVFFMYFVKEKKFHDRKFIFIAFLCIIAAIIFFEPLYALIRHVFQFDKYAQNGVLNLDAFSSGRLTYWKNAYNIFLQNPIFGIGEFYTDNFYLCALASGGLVFGGFIIIIFIKRIFINIKLFNNLKDWDIDKNYAEVFSLCTFFYIIISFFEGYPPFGPGVASMYFWILCGIVDGIQLKHYNLNIMNL